MLQEFHHLSWSRFQSKKALEGSYSNYIRQAIYVLEPTTALLFSLWLTNVRG